jgi:hypothetical protein
VTRGLSHATEATSATNPAKRDPRTPSSTPLPVPKATPARRRHGVTRGTAEARPRGNKLVHLEQLAPYRTPWAEARTDGGDDSLRSSRDVRAPSGASPTRVQQAGHTRAVLGRSHELLFPFSAGSMGERRAVGLPHPPDCAHRFSQPLDALLPPTPSGFVSPR